MPSDSPQPSLKRDRMLATAFRSPATASTFADPIPGSTFPACYFASHDAVPTPVRLSAPRLVWFAPTRPLLRFGPLPVPGLALPAHSQSPLPFRTFTSLRIKAFNCISTGWPAFRFRPISSRSPSPVLLLGFRTRIIVPGPLRFRRLAVPQTSWNLLHNALV